MRTYYHVAPRYTAGSPAQVDSDTALRVAGEERVTWERALLGVYGDDERRAARDGGLEGIVYSTTEFRGHIHIIDAITDKRYKVPVKDWVGGDWYKRTDRDQFLYLNREVTV